MEDLHELVLNHFQECIDKSEAALQNAKLAGPDGAAMQTAAERLAKDGRRAMNKVAPLCQRNFELFSTNFVAAIKSNDTVADLMQPLEEVLFDFDDFVEVDGFDAARFSELRLLLRKAALGMVGMLRRMDLDSPRSAASSVFDKTPPLPSMGLPLPLAPPHAEDHDSKDAGFVQEEALEPTGMSTQSGPIPAWDDSRTRADVSTISSNWSEVDAEGRQHMFHAYTISSSAESSYATSDTMPSPTSMYFKPTASGWPSSVDSPSYMWSPAPAFPTVNTQQLQTAGLELARRRTWDFPIPITPDTCPKLPLRHTDTTIGVTSSFQMFHEFCPGAKDVMRGGLGVKKIKKPGIGAGNVTVAKCQHCFYELDWVKFVHDIEKQDRANYQTAGVGFRLRFLSKSHMATKQVDDQLYACLFCVQVGHTTEESDATVFFSQKQLFAHLARHPRPLPEVPGLTVFDEAELPPYCANNYDLHFPNPPVTSQMTAIAEDVARMPTVVAIETVRAGALKSMRSPSGSGSVPPLQFASSARIVGVDFPPRWAGEWAVGWHDNQRGVFPLSSVRLEPPMKGDIAETPSHLQAISRWKRNPGSKEFGGWLKFDKGEMITGITYVYHDHWCWAGYNAKKKWGIFPRVFLDLNTISEGPSPPLSPSMPTPDSKSRTKRWMSLSHRDRKTRETHDLRTNPIN